LRLRGLGRLIGRKKKEGREREKINEEVRKGRNEKKGLMLAGRFMVGGIRNLSLDKVLKYQEGDDGVSRGSMC